MDNKKRFPTSNLKDGDPNNYLARAIRKEHKKTVRQKLKKEVWKWCSLYIRQRDSVNGEWGYCCTCGKIVQIKYGDAGHFIGRGLGGSSGVYFDERNIHLQCKTCNAFEQGAYTEYRKFMLDKYGQEVIDELELKHRTHNYTLMDLEGLLLYYKQEYESLKKASI